MTAELLSFPFFFFFFFSFSTSGPVLVDAPEASSAERRAKPEA